MTCSSCRSTRSRPWSIERPEATRQLASRARRRVKGAEVPAPDADLARQREVVDAFFRAARGGDLDALVAVLDPDVVLREDYRVNRPLRVFRGAAAVTSRAAPVAPGCRGSAGPGQRSRRSGRLVRGRPFAILGFTVRDGKIIEIDAIVGAERVADRFCSPGLEGPARTCDPFDVADPRSHSAALRPAYPALLPRINAHISRESTSAAGTRDVAVTPVRRPWGDPAGTA